MTRLAALLAVAVALSPFPAGAQIEATPVPALQPKVTLERHPTIFSGFVPESPLDALPVTLHPPARMNPHDRSLELQAERSIAKRAGYAGFDLNSGAWTYSQVVCPAFPNHLFLRFTRNQGPGDVSVFTASIPRNGTSPVRIIPIERRGYSLFSPAPVNALTIEAFNHIRAEERPDGPTPWVGISLCYAALAGVKLPLNPNMDSGSAQTVSSILTLDRDSGAIMRLTDTASAPPTEWKLTFDRKGKLIKSSVKDAGISAPRKVPAAPGIRSLPVQSTAAAPAATPPA
jgi:hypothetical protein